MGGGKGSISECCHPIRSGRIIIEVSGRCEFEEVSFNFYYIHFTTIIGLTNDFIISIN